LAPSTPVRMNWMLKDCRSTHPGIPFAQPNKRSPGRCCAPPLAAIFFRPKGRPQDGPYGERSSTSTVGAVLCAALGCVLFPASGPPAGRPLRGHSSKLTVGAVLCAALGCVPFLASGPPAGRPLRGHSSNHTVGAVINRPHWWMTFAPDKTAGLYRRAIDNLSYNKTPRLCAHIIHYPLSTIHSREPPWVGFDTGSLAVNK